MELSDVQPLVGQHFDVPAVAEGKIYVSLALVEASVLGIEHEGGRKPFSLIFNGPSSSPLEQGAYVMHNTNLGEESIFIVPLSDDGTVRQYQAIYN
jgi:hypothetical protein